MKVLCVTHYLGDVMGSLGEILRERGDVVETVRADKGSVTGIDPAAHDLAIIMGGPMGVYQEHLFPWIRDEIVYARARMDHDRPILGVCLGSQIMAQALDSLVHKGERGPELGWHPLDVNATGIKTPVRHFDRPHTMMLHWHGDTYALPQDAELLASTDMYPAQAWRYKKNALGLQFHPEMTRDVLEEWIMVGDFYHIEKNICPLPEFRRQIDEYEPTLRSQTHKFFHEWLNQIG
jgi:GMP synthase (glutamine-hydrolysing)